MNTKFMSAIFAIMFCSGAFAALPEADADGNVVSSDASIQVTSADQATIDGLKSITLSGAGSTSAPLLYAPAKDSVTISCPINFTKANTVVIGLRNSELAFSSKVTHPAGRYIDILGTAILKDGFEADGTFVFETAETRYGNIIIDTILPSTSSTPNFQTRGGTTIRFNKQDVFANLANKPTFILGKASNPSGIIDLNGYDQTIKAMSMFPYNGSYNDTLLITSENAATLTLKQGFVTSTGTSVIFDGRLTGGVSFKLDSADGTGVASFSNTVYNSVTQYSTTTGALISASGTIRLLDGCRFNALSEIRKEGTGNFEISTSVLGGPVKMMLDGTGKVTLNSNIAVQYAMVKEGDTWRYLDSGDYDGSNLASHLAGSGVMTVANGDPESHVAEYTWTGAESEDITAAGNWEGNVAPKLTDGTSILVFPETGRNQVLVSGELRIKELRIASNGGFTLNGAEGASITVLDGGLSISEAADSEVVINADIRFGSVSDVPCLVSNNAKVVFNGKLSSLDIEGVNQYKVLMSGAAKYRFAADNSQLLHKLYITNAVEVVAATAYAFGRTGLELVNENMVLLPQFEELDRIDSPLTIDMPFAADESLSQWITKTPFTFGGKLTMRGQNWSAASDKLGNEYFMAQGYFVLGINGNVCFSDGIDLSAMRRLQFMIDENCKVRIDGEVTRGTFRSNYSSNTAPVEVRFYSSSKVSSRDYTSSVAEIGGRFVNGGEIYASLVTLRIDSEQKVLPNDTYMPFVNSRHQAYSSNLGALDLNGHDLNFRGFESAVPVNILNGYVTEPNDAYFVRSATPATMRVNVNSGALTNTVPLRFEGAAGLSFESPWNREWTLTNVHSVTTGKLSVGSGSLVIGAGAGWAGESEVEIKGTGTLTIDEGAWGFSGDKNGAKRHSKVTLKFPEQNNGKLILNGDCEVAELVIGETQYPERVYRAADLAPYVEGEGRLIVCGKNRGSMLIIK